MRILKASIDIFALTARCNRSLPRWIKTYATLAIAFSGDAVRMNSSKVIPSKVEGTPSPAHRRHTATLSRAYIIRASVMGSYFRP